MKDLFDAHKRSEALLQGEKNLTEMIARGDSLEAMLEGSCRLVEEALPGSLAIILLLDGKRLRRGVARGQVEALIYSLDVLATASEPKKFLGKMLSTICRRLSGLSVALWLYDEPSESMTMQLIADSTGTLDFNENRLLIESPLSWGKNSGYQELLFTACPVLCEDTVTDPRLCGEMRDYFLMTGVKKFLAVPILAEGRVRGRCVTQNGSHTGPRR